MGRCRLHKNPLSKRDVALSIERNPLEVTLDTLIIGGCDERILTAATFLGKIANRLEAEGVYEVRKQKMNQLPWLVCKS